MSGVISKVAALACRPRGLALPDPVTILAALPMPAIVLDGEDRFRFANWKPKQSSSSNIPARP